MATGDDDLLTRFTQRHVAPSSIEEIINRQRQTRDPEPEPVEPPQTLAKKSDPLPRRGDPYRAHARFLGQLNLQPRLIHFVLGDFVREGFAYGDLRRLRHLPSPDPGQGPVILMRFVEAEITDVLIEGRLLDDVYHWIGECAMPWLWEQPPGFKTADEGAAVITRITIRKATLSGRE
jgi:hypothetical protein